MEQDRAQESKQCGSQVSIIFSTLLYILVDKRLHWAKTVGKRQRAYHLKYMNSEHLLIRYLY